MKKIRKIARKLPTLGENVDLRNKKHLGLIFFLVFYNLLLLYILYTAKISTISNAANIAPPTITANNDTVKFASDEILVKVRKSVKSRIKENSINVGVNSISNINKEFKVREMEKAVKESGKSKLDSEIFQWYRIKFDEPKEELNSTNSEVKSAIARGKSTGNLKKDRFFSKLSKYRKDPNIEGVEPNYIVNIDQASTPSSIPNDPYYSDLWGLKKINAEGAWNISKGSSNIIVAVVDTGIDRNHEDIQGNMWINKGEIPNNGIDDDGNGYVDDYYGCNFIDMMSKVCKDPMDDDGHGTHVAGIIGAVGNNGKGITGVSWNSKIMSLKFIRSMGGGTYSDGSNSIIYAADNGAKVINNSWAGSAYSQILHDAIEYAYSKNVVIVAAAGNNSTDVSRYWPANEAKVIAVSAINSDDTLASFSNYGTKIDVAAPGGALSLKSAISPRCTGFTVGTNYCHMGGTSMAAPHVAGLATLILSADPSFSNVDVRRVLRDFADDLGSPGFDIYFGYGRINAAKALSKDKNYPTLTPTPTPSTPWGPTSEYIYCSKEGEICTIPGYSNTAFGANGKYVYTGIKYSGSFICNFTVPDGYFPPGTTKYCFYKPLVSIPTPTPTPTKTPTPTPIPNMGIDTDRDGYSDTVEIYLGTNPNKACITDALNEVEASKSGKPSKTWPADLTTVGGSLNKIDITDLSSFTTPIYRLYASPGQANFDRRWDIVPGSGGLGDYINITDLSSLITVVPPMFGGQRAYLGPTCTP